MPIRPHDIGSWGLFVMYENMLNSSVFEYTGGKRDLALLDKRGQGFFTEANIKIKSAADLYRPEALFISLRFFEKTKVCQSRAERMFSSNSKISILLSNVPN